MQEGGCISLPVDMMERFWKGDGDLRFVGWQYRKINKTKHILLNIMRYPIEDVSVHNMYKSNMKYT